VLAAAPEAAGRVVFSGVGKTAPRSTSRSRLAFCNSTWRARRNWSCSRRARRKLKRKARFALRVNPDVFADTHPYISTGLREHKFGIDIRQALDLQERGRQPLA
jgi:diaminopimelate decarboxylase